MTENKIKNDKTIQITAFFKFWLSAKFIVTITSPSPPPTLQQMQYSTCNFFYCRFGKIVLKSLWPF